MKERVSKNIRLIRKEKQISVQKLATKLGITRQALNNYETGIRSPSYEMLEKIAKELDVPLRRLIEEGE